LLVAYSLGFCVLASTDEQFQRPNWSAVAEQIGDPHGPRATVTWTLGEAPLRYYLSTGAIQVRAKENYDWLVKEVDFVSDGAALHPPLPLRAPRAGAAAPAPTARRAPRFPLQRRASGRRRTRLIGHLACPPANRGYILGETARSAREKGMSKSKTTHTADRAGDL